ncbi:MAG: tetratricopeptide repeat protein [Deltaproteobacteria bacterium]|nr:tetratricopeptide repeat protein [Deltaproteobacteria bacterium]MBW2386394.1 tetratricopeptide repeat protein [Deltaproteobacteria bacterium]MBW2696651.1 tetratricopeptide repeat protein [Deltaproteobacteria bacterium]
MNHRNLNLVSILSIVLMLSIGCAGSSWKSSADMEFERPEPLPDVGPIQFKPLSFEEEITLADNLRDSGQNPEAAWHYVRAMQLKEENPLPRQRLGYMQLSRDVRRAEKIFEALVEEHPELSSGHVGLGLARIAKGDHTSARIALETALELDSNSAEAHMGLGMLDDQVGAYDLAAAHYEQAHLSDPQGYEIQNSRGISLLRSGEFELAIEAFRDAIYLEPRDPTLYNNLGIALGQLGDYRGAYENFKEYSTEADALNNLGYVCLINGESGQAIKYFERSLLAGPSDRTKVLVNLRAAEDASLTP